jgi:anti-sigma-K factor RskA
MGAISLPPPPGQAVVLPKTDQQQQNATQQIAVTPAVQASMDRIARALEAANAGRNSTAQADAQNQIAFWGMVIAVLGAFEALLMAAAVVLVAFTLHATRRVAKAAEDTARAALEAANPMSRRKPVKEESAPVFDS